MNWNWKEYNKQKTLFRSYYCSSCNQTKPCGILGLGKDCCPCYYQSEQAEAQEYSNYQQVYQRRVEEKREKFQQLERLRNYKGCLNCKSLEVDAYDLYVENKLVCQPCLLKKEGETSSPISFLKQQEWYQKRWGVNLTEWLTKFQCLPVNAECAREWLKDKGHLNKSVGSTY